MSTVDYYNKNAKAFFESTYHVDMSELYDRFLEKIPTGSHLLDLGCGSGRDLNAFYKRGYSIIGYDASDELVKLAKANTDAEIVTGDFSDLAFENQFDGAWACASLLHVPRENLEKIIGKISIALKSQGRFYASFKYGASERNVNGRLFTDMNEQLAQRLFARSSLHIESLWVTIDKRPDREEKWLNILAVKK